MKSGKSDQKTMLDRPARAQNCRREPSHEERKHDRYQLAKCAAFERHKVQQPAAKADG